MTYSTLLNWLAQFNLFAWLIAAIVSLIVWRYTKTKGWFVIMIGAVFVVLRQLWKFLPNYKDAQVSDTLFNTYMMRYILGEIGAILLCIGLIMLIINYYIVKTRLED